MGGCNLAYICELCVDSLSYILFLRKILGGLVGRWVNEWDE